jgi:predicted dehydrogenase
MTKPAPTPTRREMLAAAGLALGMPPALAQIGAGEPVEQRQLSFAPRRPLAPGEPVRVGVIGTGPMGLEHCRALAKIPEQVRLVALCDVCRPRLEQAAQACREEQPKIELSTHRAYRELLALDLHGVVIATPVHWHTQMALDALEAGLDVYVEKPLSNSLADALAVERAVSAGGGILQVGTQMLREPKYALAKRLIAEGAIGRPTSAQTSFCRNSREGEWLYRIDPSVQPGEQLDWEAWCGPLAPEPWNAKIFHRWRRYRKFSTGILDDLLVHVLTPLVWAADPGWPVRVTAAGARLVDLEMENHDQLQVTAQFENGLTLTAMGSTCNEQGLETIVRGHEATLYLGGNRCVLTPERINPDLDPQDHQFESHPVQHEHRRDWIEGVRSRRPPLGDATTACKVAAILEMGSRAVWEGSTYVLDPATRAIERV